MKKNEKKELHDKTDDVLKELLTSKQKHLFDLRSQAVTEKLEDPTQLGKTKRDIALVKTVLHQRALASAESK